MGATGRRNRAYAPRMAPEQRRDQLLDGVLRIIVEQGVHKVSIDAVAREAGVTRPVVYGLFTDTDDLLRASLDREERGASAQLTALLPLLDTEHPATALRDFLAGFLDAVLAEPQRWRAILTLVDSSTPAFRRRVEHGRAAMIAVLEDQLRAATGHDPTVDVELAAHVLLAAIWDASRLVLARPADFPRDRVLAFADQILSVWTDVPPR